MVGRGGRLHVEQAGQAGLVVLAAGPVVLDEAPGVGGGGLGRGDVRAPQAHLVGRMDGRLVGRDEHVRHDVLLEVCELGGAEGAVAQLRLEDDQALLHLDARHGLAVVEHRLEGRGGGVGGGGGRVRAPGEG